MNMLAKTGTIWIVRGIASVIFGVLTVVRPGASIAALVLLFGVYALVDGAFLLGFAFRREGPKAHYIVSGLLSVLAGALTFMYPGLTAISLYLLMGAWAVSTGLTELALAFVLRSDEVRVGGLVLAGLLSVAAGVALFTLPLAGVVAILSLVTVYAIVNGIFLIAAGVRLHNVVRPLHAA